MADESVAAAKIVGHWLGFAPALLIAALVAAALFQMDGAAMLRLVLALAIGTPALAALGVTAAALTAGPRGAGAIAGLLVLPRVTQAVIFGAAAAAEDGTGAETLLAAVSLV